MRKVDRVGLKYGRLLVISETYGKSKGKIYYKCLCDCGVYKDVSSSNLSSGEVLSCGCLKKESWKSVITKHNLRRSPIYAVYHRMKGRCLNEKHPRYSYYGGRGIGICQRWLEPEGVGFLNFVEDMSPSYQEGFELDRTDNMGDYSPDNCRWVSNSINQANKRKKLCTICKYKGVSLTRSGKYSARVSIKGRGIYVGVYNDERSAAEAYDNYIITHGLGYTTNKSLGLYEDD